MSELRDRARIGASDAGAGAPASLRRGTSRPSRVRRWAMPVAAVFSLAAAMFVHVGCSFSIVGGASANPASREKARAAAPPAPTSSPSSDAGGWQPIGAGQNSAGLGESLAGQGTQVDQFAVSPEFDLNSVLSSGDGRGGG